LAKIEPLDLISDIETASDEYEQAVFGTYTFEPPFFENKILPILQKRDAENILVLVDRSEYEGNFSQVKLAGKEYYLDHCKSGKIFHPKFMLLTWENGGKLIIGSANLNENEWRTAGEILVDIEYDTADPNQDSISAFWEMSQFLQTLVNKSILKSKKHSQKLMEIITGTKWLANVNKPKLSDKIRLLDNIQKPIIDQVLERIEKQEIIQVDFMSPIFGGTEFLTKRFADMGCKKLRFFLQPDKVIGFSLQNLRELRSSGVEFDVVSSQFKEHEGRFNHAKVLTVKTKEKSYCLTGSPNATRAALTERADVGNLELAALRVEKGIHYFDYIVSPDIFDLKIIDPTIVPFKPAPNRKDLTSTDLLLTEARLKEKTLLLEFEPNVQASEAIINLKHSEGKEKKSLNGKISGRNSITQELDAECFNFCSKPTFATLEINLNDKTLVSSARWISTESLEFSPRKRDIQRIKESNGRYGLINLLNQFSQSSGSVEFLVYSLQWIDFDDLAPNIDWARRRILQRNTGNGDETEGVLFDPTSLEPNQIMQKIINRHQKKLQKAMENLDSQEELDENLPKVSDLFLFLSKITIWFVQVKPDLIEELRWIWVNSQKMLDTLSELSKDYSKTVENLVRELSLPEHMIILGYFIDQLQKKQGYDARYPSVVGVFKDTLNRVVQFGYKFGCFPNSETSFDRFEEIAKEYREFKNLDIDQDRLFQFFLNLSHPSSSA
jgi:hypothetical protein